VAAVATVALMAADRTKIENWQATITKCGSGSSSGGNSGLGNGNHGSVAATAAVALADNRWRRHR
jgi:hypothetical protein